MLRSWTYHKMMFEGKGSRLSQRTRGLAVMVLVVIGLIAAQPFLWNFVNELASQLNEKRFQIKQINKIKDYNKEIKDEHNKQKVFLDQLTAVIPQSRETLQIIERLEALASEVGANIKIESIKEGEAMIVAVVEQTEERSTTVARRRAVREEQEEVKKDELKILPLVVTVTAKAAPSVLLRYIEAVEHVQELTKVMSFKLNASSEKDESGYVLSMDVIFYLQDYEIKGSE